MDRDPVSARRRVTGRVHMAGWTATEAAASEGGDENFFIIGVLAFH
jgi:hypothetical protein